MFVRFRKQPNGGDRPFAARDDAVRWQWAQAWGRRRRRFRRWMIGRGDQHLEPYRIKVILLENTRLNGKVKQELVATLGSIDATWLESFWQPNPDPTLRREDWELYSLRRRTEFWQGVLERMGKIGDNRLNKDERVAIRRAIHKVIPWVMDGERKRLELLKAEDHYREMQQWHKWTEDSVARDLDMGRRISEGIPAKKAESARWAECAFNAGLKIAKLRQE